MTLVFGAILALDPATLFELFDRSWTTVAALLFAVGCTVYLTVILALGMATCSLARLRRSAAANVEADGSPAH
jgi:sugar phosphate permease